MQYTITHKCGHTETVHLYGKGTERQNRIAWLESLECEDCRIAAAKDMTGSPKQIAWASDIRKDMVAKLNSYRHQTEWQYEEGEELDAFFATVDDAIALVNSQTSAKWFIDNRSESGLSLYNGAMTYIKSVA